MQSKIRQLTDSIHGTIYISALEYEMMSTPFFYRLHDVYQSSTVYMTFPSNRTKRFEHSLGTMELSGQMFYSAVTNASINDQKTFLNELKQQFELILSSLENRGELEKVRIYQAEADELSILLPVDKCNMRSFLELLKDTMTGTPILDRALVKQEVCFSDLFDYGNTNAIETIFMYQFLYQSALQALRIAALFHDIGHPPFSHIIEYTLKRIYKKDDSCYKREKRERFKKCLEKYIESNSIDPMLLDINSDTSTIKGAALHEQIGLHILYNAYRGILSKFITEYKNHSDLLGDRLRALYLVTVLEFTFGILLEKSPILTSLHRIIDGPIDVDRLDYIARDTRNSGLNWGSEPCSRIISSAKFVQIDRIFKIAFPEKICDDIDDLLINRYKIFQRINYHHKSVKTSELMQRSVEMLAEDYLLSEANDEIMPEIMNLWGFLGGTFGVNEAENQISQWTDSWLVSVLSNALNTLSAPDKRRKLVNESIGRTEETLNRLFRMLEEVQLNRKRYFPLLKRQRDALLLKDKIIGKAGITAEALDKLSTSEYNKLTNGVGDDADSAREALYRIRLLQNEILSVANFSLLDTLLPDNKTCQEIIEDVLQNEKENRSIQDYFLWSNTGLYKLGASETTDITLYRKWSEPYKYDVSTVLMKKLNAYRAGCLWMFAYVCLPDLPEAQIDERIDGLFDKIATALGTKIQKQMNELFGFDQVIGKSVS